MVSEENGVISVAFQGELYRDLDSNEMRELLQRIFSSSAVTLEKSGFLDKFREEQAQNANSEATD